MFRWLRIAESIRFTGRAALMGFLLMAPTYAQSAFEVAAGLVGQGDYQAALVAAQQAPSPLQRAQAQLHVFHYAGDLDAALNAGREGLAVDGKDPWLLENAAYVALSLGLGKPAVTWLETLQEVSPGKAPEWMMEEALLLQATREAEATASTRSKSVVLISLAALSAALLFGVLRQGRGAGRGASTG